MPDFVAGLLRAGLWLASFGPVAGAAVAGLGLAILVAGHRAFRPAASVVGAAGAAWGLWQVVAILQPKLPISLALLLACAALVVAATGLVFPRLAVAVACAAGGLAAGVAAKGLLDADQQPLALAGGAVAGAVIAAIFSSALPILVTPIVAASAVAAGAWGAIGSTGLSPALFRLPVVWLSIAGVLAIVGVAIERARAERRAASPARAQVDAKKRIDDEDRARLERYMKM